MASIKIADHKIWVDDHPISLLSGEMHYWRLDPANWRPILKRVRELGLDVIATYICWDFHEIRHGEFDFTGTTDPRRNILGFLELLTEQDFWIIIRPGPYIYSEWKNNGVPDHAASYHRLDPAFLKLAETYMACVTEAIRPYLVTNGGRVILWQADNEIDPWPHFYSEELGLGAKTGIFQDYLQERYGEIAHLNTAWGTRYSSFTEARAVSELFLDDPYYSSRYRDFRAFIHEYVNRVAKWAVDTYRNLGVDVPIMLNTYSGVGTQRWADMEDVADIVGPDIYPSREFLNRGGSKEHDHILQAVRYTCTYSRLPYIPEYEAGIWHDWLEDVGTLTPNHYRLICLSALQAGAAGWNWYMLVNRDNWYQSPINEWGRVRPDLFDVFRQIAGLYKQVDPTTLERITNIAVTFDPLQRATDRPGQELLQSLYNADINYDFYDLSHGTTDKQFLLYSGGSWLSEAGQEKLVRFVEDGGHLVCAGTYPRQDEHLQPLNMLNIPTPNGILSGFGNIQLSLWGERVESTWIYNYDDVPGEAIAVKRLSTKNLSSEELRLQFDLQTGLQYTIGYSLSRGQGQITVIGVQPTSALLLLLLRHFNLAIPCRSHTTGIVSALLRRNREYYLIATHAGTEDKGSAIEFAPELLGVGKWQVKNLITGQLTIMDTTSGTHLPIYLPRKDGVILHLSQ